MGGNRRVRREPTQAWREHANRETTALPTAPPRPPEDHPACSPLAKITEPSRMIQLFRCSNCQALVWPAPLWWRGLSAAVRSVLSHPHPEHFYTDTRTRYSAILLVIFWVIILHFYASLLWACYGYHLYLQNVYFDSELMQLT